MLTIQNQQINILSKLCGQSFSSKIKSDLSIKFPEESITSDRFDNLIEYFYRESRKDGMNTEREIYKYMEITFLIHRPISEVAEFSKILSRKDLRNEEKLMFIENLIEHFEESLGFSNNPFPELE